jgi:hypothetical protein
MVGLPFDSGPVRATRYEEAVEIVRRLHDGETLDWSGQHYRLDGCQLLVAPVQRPIPLLLGGGGPRMTQFAAQWADTVAFVPKSLPRGGLDPAEFSEIAFEHKISVLDKALTGRASKHPERAILVFGLHRSADEIPLEDWTSREIASASPYFLVGDTERVVNDILARRERWGISHLTFWEEDIEAAAPIVERLRGRKRSTVNRPRAGTPRTRPTVIGKRADESALARSPRSGRHTSVVAGGDRVIDSNRTRSARSSRVRPGSNGQPPSPTGGQGRTLTGKARLGGLRTSLEPQPDARWTPSRPRASREVQLWVVAREPFSGAVVGRRRGR